MRNPERLDLFYDEMKEIHKKAFPDWRFGQTMMNFLSWVQNTKKRDPFFPEEDEMLKLFKEYANENSMWYRDNTDTSGYADNDNLQSET